MRELLTPALAGLNPRAYIAHFRRLELDAQRQYLGALGPDELRLHLQTLGEVATVGLVLTVAEDAARLEATVAGTSLGAADGEAASGLQARALAEGRALGNPVVSGLLVTSLIRLPQTQAALRALGWHAKTLVLTGDCGGGDCPPSLGWSLRGSLGDAGTFYMPNEALIWDERTLVEDRLRPFAAGVGAVFDVRLG